MTGSDVGEDDTTRIDELRDRWNRFDNTGDESLVVDIIADDVVVLPPGGEPVNGKAALVDSLREATGGLDVDHSSQRLMLSGDLAVDYISVEGVKLDGEGNETGEVSHKAIDVYRREANGDWEMVFSIWNEPA